MKKYAIIGMAGRFPDANTPTQFFDNLLNGKSSFRKLSNKEVSKLYVLANENKKVKK